MVACTRVPCEPTSLDGANSFSGVVYCLYSYNRLGYTVTFGSTGVLFFLEILASAFVGFKGFEFIFSWKNYGSIDLNLKERFFPPSSKKNWKALAETSEMNRTPRKYLN